MAADPHALFESWFAEARACEPDLPEAMSLATCGEDGRPSSRMVLLKRHGESGFTFHTNLQSRKGEEIRANPKAALLFHWKSLGRQVRIEGRVEAVTEAEADAYYRTRPRESRLSAWASDQSRPLASRDALEARFAEAAARFADGEPPRPPYWSGLRVVPHRMEFWSDREHRMHERRLFVREGESWTESLLYP